MLKQFAFGDSWFWSVTLPILWLLLNLHSVYSILLPMVLNPSYSNGTNLMTNKAPLFDFPKIRKTFSQTKIFPSADIKRHKSNTFRKLFYLSHDMTRRDYIKDKRWTNKSDNCCVWWCRLVVGGNVSMVVI